MIYSAAYNQNRYNSDLFKCKPFKINVKPEQSKCHDDLVHEEEQGDDGDEPFNSSTLSPSRSKYLTFIFSHIHIFTHYHEQGDDGGEPFELGREQQHKLPHLLLPGYQYLQL